MVMHTWRYHTKLSNLEMGAHETFSIRCPEHTRRAIFVVILDVFTLIASMAV